MPAGGLQERPGVDGGEGMGLGLSRTRGQGKRMLSHARNLHCFGLVRPGRVLAHLAGLFVYVFVLVYRCRQVKY